MFMLVVAEVNVAHNGSSENRQVTLMCSNGVHTSGPKPLQVNDYLEHPGTRGRWAFHIGRVYQP